MAGRVRVMCFFVRACALLGAMAMAHAERAAAQPTSVGSAFTYQGRLKSSNSLLTDRVDFQFKLFDRETGGVQKGITFTVLADPDPSVKNVKNGLFAFELDFVTGAANPGEVFNGEARWLQIAVRHPAGSGSYVTVLPRQALTPAPYAINAVNGGGWIASGENTVHMGGSVGINYASPGQDLSVVNKEGNNEAVLELGTLGAGGVDFLLIASNASATVPNTFRIRHNFSAVEPFTINAISGNVGIGTTNPSARLSVADGTDAGQFGGGFVVVGNPNGANIAIDDNEIMARFNGTAVDLILNGEGGNVGIGPGGFVPASRLHVIGCVTAQNTPACSDIRFKRNIQNFVDGLAIVNQLRSVHFDWKKDEFPEREFDDHPQIGFVAQEVDRVLPAVVFRGNDGYLSVDYARLTPVLVEAVKELHEIVNQKDDELASERRINEQQQSEIASLNARLAALEKLVDGHLARATGE